jgi:diguanylate cyclase (GGDEF)-like protein/PAS domain S-box-containing protein
VEILLIEDNPADVYLLQESFAPIQEVQALQVAGSLAAAAEFLEARRPDCVLLDLSLPDSFGLDTFHAVQAMAPDLPVIILSGNADQTQALDAVRNGAQDYLLKGETDGDKLVRIMRYAIERARVKADLRRSQLRYRRLYDSVPVGLFQASSDGDILSVNAMLVRILGFGSEEHTLRASRAGSLIADPAQYSAAIEKLQNAPLLENFEIDLNHCDGGIVTVLVNAAAVRDEVSADVVVEGTVVDITERKLTESQLRVHAERDELTGLVNRRAFRAITEDAIAAAEANAMHALPALLMFDLDGFKAVNDNLGHAAGDELLCEVAKRVHGVLRTGDTLARIGGDEFAILCQVAEAANLDLIAGKVLAAVAAPYEFDSKATVGASIGIAAFPAHGRDYDALLAAADAAMYAAKRAGKGCFRFAERTAARSA